MALVKDIDRPSIANSHIGVQERREVDLSEPAVHRKFHAADVLSKALPG